ncbi:hypothetical protein ACFX13_007970 [Malus domestica]
MGRKRLLVVLKPIEADPVSQSEGPSRITNPQSQMLHHLDSRRKVHNDAISCCQNILLRKPVEWNSVVLNDLSQPVHDVDLVVTVGGDGTLLQASHFIDDSVPVLGVNSDPTQPKEVEKLSNEIDASRSTGYLCATTIDNFEEVLDNILQGRTIPSKLTRISVYVNSQVLPTYALNDILIAHSCPAALSQFSFKIKRDGELCSPLVNSRSSGLRVSTAAGSTAAMLSAGGFPMPILSQDLQFMNGDAIEISSKAPILKVFLSHYFQTTVKNCCKY